MARARNKVGIVDAVNAEQLLRHTRERWRTIHLELGYTARALVPAREHQARIVAAMIVMQVREEEVRHPRRLNLELEQPMMSAETMIQEDNVVADLHHVAGAHSPQ